MHSEQGVDMREIHLNRGLVALVDDVDFERVSAHRWYAVNTGTKDKPRYYVQRSKWKAGTNETMYLHRFIANDPESMDVGFHDGNGLNNQRSNLKITPHGRPSEAKVKERDRVATLEVKNRELTHENKTLTEEVSRLKAEVERYERMMALVGRIEFRDDSVMAHCLVGTEHAYWFCSPEGPDFDSALLAFESFHAESDEMLNTVEQDQVPAVEG
jgi:hypothetical protein